MALPLRSAVDLTVRGEPIDLPGGRTTVRDLAGPEGAPTLLLLHGWMASADLNWSTTFSHLVDHFRVIALDHRGHGDGIRNDPAASFSLETCADDAADLLRIKGIDQAIVVGYSMGGPIAQLLWKRHPELVAGLVLCATADHFVETPIEHLLAPVTRVATSITRRVPRPVWSWLAQGAAAHRGRDIAPLRNEAVRVAGSHDWKSIFEAGQAIAAFDSRRWVSRISVPTAVVATLQDRVVPTIRQMALAGRIPGAALHRCRGHHDVCVNRPAEFVPVFTDACRHVARRVELASGGGRAVDLVGA